VQPAIRSCVEKADLRSRGDVCTRHSRRPLATCRKAAQRCRDGRFGARGWLKDNLVEAVKAALRERGFHSKTCEAVKAVNRYEPRFDFKTEADVARRAVCFGAADPDKPGFRYIEKFEPFTHATIKAAPKWV